MITAEEARELSLTGQAPDKFKSVEMKIKQSCKRGYNETIILGELPEDIISQLTALGYSVESITSRNHKISWL